MHLPVSPSHPLQHSTVLRSALLRMAQLIPLSTSSPSPSSLLTCDCIYLCLLHILCSIALCFFMWRNEHRNLSTYIDNCLDANGFGQWQPAKCHTVTACKACIRDKVVTEVHLGELRSALLATKEVVDQWELRMERSFVELSDDLTADG
ncbi:unnamed protein product [Closterium sp. Yama58-4]|nr:unnamed protein product [Closterium sp. Yama58-4]